MSETAHKPLKGITPGQLRARALAAIAQLDQIQIKARGKERGAAG
jgi:hypothetical protein